MSEEERIKRLEYVLLTLINWLAMELGEHNAIKLTALLQEPDQ